MHNNKINIITVVLPLILTLYLVHPLLCPPRVVAGENADFALIEKLGKDGQMYRKCLSQLTPEELSKHLEIKRIPVRKRNEALLIITPQDANLSSECFLWGAHEPMTSVYRQVGYQYHQLMEPSAYGSFKVMKTYSNGYPDLKTYYPIHAGESVSIDLYKFNGQRYVLKKNITQRVVR